MTSNRGGTGRRRTPTPCANPAHEVLVIGREVYYLLPPEKRVGLKPHGARGYCDACDNRLKRRGTLDYAPKNPGPRGPRPPSPCAGGCGFRVMSRAGLREIPLEERGDLRGHAERGLCYRCLRKAKKTGTLIDFERKIRSNEEVVAEYDELRSQGNYDLRIIADRMGVTWSALDAALYRARKRGDKRAELPHRSLRAS